MFPQVWQSFLRTLTKQRPAADQPVVTPALALAIVRLLETSHPVEPVTFSLTHVEDAQPKVIHIYNLDDGPRAIVLPHAQSEDAESSRQIRIYNASGGGVREIGPPRQDPQ